MWFQRTIVSSIIKVSVPCSYELGDCVISLQLIMYFKNLVFVTVNALCSTGMFFQWVTCTVVWISGLVVNCIRGFPTFYPLCMVGGAIWATGTVTIQTKQ